MKQKVVIEMERLRAINSGLGQYCEGLGNELLKHHSNEFDLSFYTSNQNTFSNAKKISTSLKDKLFGISLDKNVVFHATHQECKYLPRDKNIPVVLTIHDLNFIHKYSNKSKIKNRLKRVQNLINRSAVVIYISEYTKQEVHKYLSVSNGKKEVIIYNGVSSINNENISKVNLPTNNYIFSIGVIQPKKNFHVVLPILKSNPDLHYVIAGNTTNQYSQFIIDAAKNLKIENRVHLIGEVTNEEKNYLYKNCQAFMFPSLSEGFGMPAIEAMQVGKPVFVSDKTSLPEIAGEEAYYFNFFDEKTVCSVFENGMKEYNGNILKADKIMAWGNQFTWEKAAKKYAEIYLSL